MTKDVSASKNSVCYTRSARTNDYSYMKEMLFSCLIYLLLGFLISGATFRGGCFIGGVAFIGAAGASICGLFSLIGVSIGYVLFFGIGNTIHYLAAGVFIYTTAYIFQYLRLYRTHYFMPVIAMFIVSVIHAFGAVQIVRNDSSIFSDLVVEILLCGILTYSYSYILRKDIYSKKSKFNIYSCNFILATVFMALSGIRIANLIYVANIISTSVYLFICYQQRKSITYPIALLFGLALKYSQVDSEHILLVFLGYSFSDFLVVKKTKIGLSIYCLVVSIAVSFLLETQVNMLFRIFETILGILIFLLFTMKTKFNNKYKEDDPFEVPREEQLYALSDLMETISSQIDSNCDEAIDTLVDLDAIFDRAVEQVCKQCDKKMICWKSQIYDMVSIFNETAPTILSRGKLLMDDLPEYFIDHCENYKCLVLAINYEIRKAYDMQLLNSIEKSNSIFTSHLFHQFSGILNNIALSFTESKEDCPELNETFCAEIGVASRKKAGETVSGDSNAYFKSKQGMLYILLSDGIGTGEFADKQSSLVIKLLEQTLNILNEPILSIELINAVLCCQRNELWRYATVDIAALDLCSGDATFYKLGATNSYIISEDDCNIIEGNAYSVGYGQDIGSIAISQNMLLQPNSFLIMTSDGVHIPDVSVLREIIQTNRSNMKLAAREILLSLCKDDSDDQTVITVAIMNR